MAAEGANPFIKERRDCNKIMLIRPQTHPRTHLQRVGSPDTEDNDRVRHPQTLNVFKHLEKDAIVRDLLF